MDTEIAQSMKHSSTSSLGRLSRGRPESMQSRKSIKQKQSRSSFLCCVYPQGIVYGCVLGSSILFIWRRKWQPYYHYSGHLDEWKECQV